jgi:hypothetical protein
MNSWLAWTVFGAVAVLLGAVGYHFSLSALRWIAFVVAVATVVYLTSYGLTHPARKPGSLTGAFARGADTLSSALIRPVSPGHHVPVPGRIGWLIIVVLLVLGYRGLEAWALHRQAPCLDLSALTSGWPDNAGKHARTWEHKHDWLVAELKFRLPAVEVRLPSILPGGSRSSELASIAEATGVTGAGLAEAIIRFFGMVWPNPPRIQVQAWVEWTPDQVSSDDATRVTVGLADQRTGASIGTKTLAAGSLDAAADAVAGYVARHIFARDRTVPPWSTSATDGADLAALLRARQERGYPECRGKIHDAWDKQIEILEGAARSNLCAGVVRYELAQLYELTGTRRPVEALLLHAANRDQFPRFYRGRYRLAMSLEMLANPHFELSEIDFTALKKALQILDRCQVTDNVAGQVGDSGQAGLSDELRRCLLDAAWRELREIERYLTWRHIIWGSFWRRNERTVLGPYWQPRHRQAFHDGVCVALLLVAVRQAQLSGEQTVGKLHHPSKTARIAAAISGDSTDFKTLLPGFPDRRPKQRPITARLRTRRWRWQCRTPSWPAAYNLACAYAALAAADPKTGIDPLVRKVVRSLEFAVCNPECEMERPSEWIGNDPDFVSLRDAENKNFTAFLDDQRSRDYPAEASQPSRQGHAAPEQGSRSSGQRADTRTGRA